MGLLAVTAWCQWTNARGGFALVGVSGDNTFSVGNVGTLAEAWRGSGLSSVLDTPTILDNRVYTGTGVYNASGTTNCTGTPKVCQPLWAIPPFVNGEPGGPTLEVSQTHFLSPMMPTSSGGGTLSASDRTGTSNCSGVPVACQPLATFRTDGFPLTNGPSVSGAVSPVLSGTSLYARGAYGMFAFDQSLSTNCALTPKICPPLWAGDVGTPTYNSAWTNPISDGVVFTATAEKVFAFDAAGVTNCGGTPKVCQPLWTAAMPVGSDLPGGIAGTAVNNGKVYVPALEGVMVFDAHGTAGCSGLPVVCVPLATLKFGSAAAIYGGITIANGAGFVGTRDGLFAFDSELNAGCSGVPLACTPLLHTLAGTWVSSPAVVLGSVYVQSNTKLVALRLPM